MNLSSRLPQISPHGRVSTIFSFRLVLVCLTLIITVAAPVHAQFPNPNVKANLTTAASPHDPAVTISYKEPGRDACKTAFSDQKQYTGWVNVPGDHPTNLFFWFVAARENSTDALTVWLNGGPGASSVLGFFTGNGPCEVVEKGINEYETRAREWGWDRASNLLFIDQPNQVGLSYDTPTPGSIDLLTGLKSTPPSPLPDDRRPETFLNGTFSSLKEENTANTSEKAAVGVWNVMQAFLGTFPQYNPPKNSSIGVNLFAESYGGKYAPVFAERWEEQNAKRIAGQISANAVEINLKSVGIVNGCIDLLTEGPYYPIMATQNTYGFSAINSVRASLANDSFYAPNGCSDLANQCETAVRVQDPNGTGDIEAVSKICKAANDYCNENVIRPYIESGRSMYDIAHETEDPFPAGTFLEFVNTQQFQSAIGATTNFTTINDQVYNAFTTTGDFARGPLIPKLATLLQRGVRIGLVYGDRDYVCNWLGGEAVSQAIARAAGGPYDPYFSQAGYAPIVVSDSDIGGVVRQYGNLSFSRIYQAGHAAPSYQPQTTFHIFARIALGTSISTGGNINLTDYSSEGPSRVDTKQKLPDPPSATCRIRSFLDTCNEEQRRMVENGEGAIVNGVFYPKFDDWPLASASPTTGNNDPSSLTGIFTATAIPDDAPRMYGLNIHVLLSFLLLVTFVIFA